MRTLTRAFALTLLVLLCVSTVPLHAVAVGTVTVTRNVITAGFVRYTVAWTASGAGAVSGNPFTVTRGEIVAVKIVPSTVTAPAALYDVTLVDTDTVDILSGVGADESATLGAYYSFDPPLFYDGTQQLDLVVANAGAAGKGTIYILIRG